MEAVLATIAFVILGASVVRLCARSQDPLEQGWLQTVLLATLAVRMAAATVFEYEPALRGYHDDATGCEIGGPMLAHAWQGLAPPAVFRSSQNIGFVYVCGVIYYVFGDYRPNGAYFIAIISTANVFLIYRLAGKLFHRRVARLAALITAIMPSLVMYGSIAIKEHLVIFLVIITVTACISLTRRLTIVGVLAVILPIAALQPMRFYVVYLLLFTTLASSLLAYRGPRRFAIVRTVFLGSLAVAAFLVFGLSGRAMEGTEHFKFETLASLRESSVQAGNSGFSPDADVSTPWKAAAFLPIGLVSLLFGPFPWQLNKARQLIVMPEMLLWWALVPSVIRGARFCLRHCARTVAPILFFCASLTLLYSVGQGELGTAVRQRNQIFVFLFIFAAVGRLQAMCRREGVPEESLLAKALNPWWQKQERPMATQAAPRPQENVAAPPIGPGRVAHCEICAGTGRIIVHGESGRQEGKRACIVCHGRGWLVHPSDGGPARSVPDTP